jgi:hypothetical protein
MSSSGHYMLEFAGLGDLYQSFSNRIVVWHVHRPANVSE